MLATGEDLRSPATAGGRPGPVTRLLHRYLDRVVAAATHDPAVTDVYVRALGMLDRPTAMFRPRVLAAAARTKPEAIPTVPPPRSQPVEPATVGSVA